MSATQLGSASGGEVMVMPSNKRTDHESVSGRSWEKRTGTSGIGTSVGTSLSFWLFGVLTSVRVALMRHDYFDVTKLPQDQHHDEAQTLHVQTSQTALVLRSFQQFNPEQLTRFRDAPKGGRGMGLRVACPIQARLLRWGVVSPFFSTFVSPFVSLFVSSLIKGRSVGQGRFLVLGRWWGAWLLRP